MIQFVLLPLLVFVIIPAHMVALNIAEFRTFNLLAFLLLAATAAVVSGVLLALDRAQARLPTRRYVAGLVEFMLFFVVITGFLLPASLSSGMIEAHLAPINVVNVVVALVIAFTLSIVAASSLRRSLYAAVVVFVAVNMVLAGPAILSLLDRSSASAPTAERSSIFELSSTRNILVLSFDGLPGPAVQDVLDLRPDLRERLRDFTFYRGAASSSSATSSSTATSLYGNRNYKNDYQTDEAMWYSAPEMLITNRLDQAGWRVSTYGAYAGLFQTRERAFHALVERPPPSTLTLLNAGLVRSLTRYFVINQPIRHDLDGLYAQALAGLTGSTTGAAIPFSAAHIPDWKVPLSGTGPDVPAYIDRLQVVHRDPVAHFLHFPHTHHPVELDRDCRWAGQNKAWYDAHQDYEGLIEQTQCGLSQMADFVDKLKAVGVYDQSLIVLKSDHGEPVSYNDPRTIESFRIRDHPMWGYGRYAPLLAIKDVGTSRPGPATDDHPVLLDDLARTLCVRSEIEADCDWYNGVDLLGDQWVGIEQAEITMFVVASEVSSPRWDNHVPVTITRGSDIVESLHAALTVEMLQSSVDCGSSLRTDDGAQLDNGRSDMDSWLTWHDRGSSFLRFRLEEPCPNASLLLETDASPTAGRDLEVLVNGQVIRRMDADAPTWSGPGSGTASLDFSDAIAGMIGDVLVEIRPEMSSDLGPVQIYGLDLS